MAQRVNEQGVVVEFEVKDGFALSSIQGIIQQINRRTVLLAIFLTAVCVLIGLWDFI